MNATTGETQPLNLLDAISLKDAARLMRGRQRKPPHIETVRMWSRQGYRPAGYEGPPLVLRTVRLGNDVVTFAVWVAEFEASRLEMGQTRPVTTETKSAFRGKVRGIGATRGEPSLEAMELEERVRRGG